MRRLSVSEHYELVRHRLRGKSIPEISFETGVPITTVQRHVLGVKVPARFLKRLKEKQGGSKERALGLRENCLEEAERILGTLSERDRLMLLLGIYWGEGTKRDFAIINSDPRLLQTFLICLREVHKISEERLSLGLRVHSDISVRNAKKFWAAALGISSTVFHKVEVIKGRKKGKLPHGMCRIRIRSGIRDRVLIQSMISLIGKDSASKVLSR